MERIGMDIHREHTERKSSARCVRLCLSFRLFASTVAGSHARRFFSSLFSFPRLFVVRSQTFHLLLSFHSAFCCSVPSALHVLPLHWPFNHDLLEFNSHFNFNRTAPVLRTMGNWSRMRGKRGLDLRRANSSSISEGACVNHCRGVY